MLGQEARRKLFPALLLAVVFPSGLILANTRATFEAFLQYAHGFHAHPACRRRFIPAAGAVCPN